MKRSQINQLIRDALAFFKEHRFHLPPFARWSPEDWRAKGLEAREIVEQSLGWDITDFGGGDFDRLGLFLFTLRNGAFGPGGSASKSYAEKIMIVREGQITPAHHHQQKMEDIINRGGGELVIQVWNDGAGGALADTDVHLSRDGVRTVVPAEGEVRLTPGESVCLPPRLWHAFWGAAGKGAVLVGEVSRVNDDHTDNYFLNSVGRFPAIEGDQDPLHLLCSDYPRYYRPAPPTPG